MPNVNIFISYRRDDASGHAGRLCDRLEDYFPGCVFMDVTGIAPGADFVSALKQKLASCQVFILVLGKSWVSITKERDGRPEPDYARIEVVTALRNGIRVIPVLVQGARMPSAGELPADLKPLATRHAMEITEPDFRNDVRRLADAIIQMYAPPRQTREAASNRVPDFTPPRTGVPLWVKLFVGLSAAVVIGVISILAIIAASVSTDTDGQANFGGATGGQSVVAPPPPPTNSGTRQKVATAPARRDDVKAPPLPLPEADDFSPPGTWLVTLPTQNGPMTGTYRLYPNYQVEFSVGASQGGGSWQYDEEESALTISGTNTFGAGFTETFYVGNRQGNVYHVQHSALGAGTMRRVQ